MSARTQKSDQGMAPCFKLWLSDDETGGGFGDGKWRLLQAVEREGSLRAATSALGISYRKGWGDLRAAEQCLGIRLLEKHRGGRNGGSTALTADGKRFLEAYRRFRTRVARAVEQAFKEELGRGER